MLEAIFFDPRFLVPVTILVLALKGFSMWQAAVRRQRIWFLLLLIVNSLGILDLVYLIFFGRDKGTPWYAGFWGLLGKGGKAHKEPHILDE